MRITGGTHRNRSIKAPEGMGTRPTTDRVREALFNILTHHDWGDVIGEPLKGGIALDAFAGTGALGIECLSRSCAEAFFFEKDRKAFAILKENIKGLGLADKAKLLSKDVTVPPVAEKAATLVFFDPPYRKNLIPPTLAALTKAGWIADNALIVAETSKTEELSLENYKCLHEKKYGDTRLSFWAKAS